MAIGPIVAQRSRQRLLARAEKKLDSILKVEVSREVTVSVHLLQGLTEVDWNDILAPKYKEAGWRVAKWVSDERDGDYIQLKA